MNRDVYELTDVELIAALRRFLEAPAELRAMLLSPWGESFTRGLLHAAALTWRQRRAARDIVSRGLERLEASRAAERAVGVRSGDEMAVGFMRELVRSSPMTEAIESAVRQSKTDPSGRGSAFVGGTCVKVTVKPIPDGSEHLVSKRGRRR